MIKVSVNGEIKTLEENLNVTQMIEALEYKVKGFAVAVNTTFVPIAKYNDTIIQEGDTIDILAPVQGG
ncbi:MAG TPA: sulfur carrier protein ThiS [Sulfurovum sp.]|nr:sulfur carrier protein ThiS [Sulfurovum sp.]